MNQVKPMLSFVLLSFMFVLMFGKPGTATAAEILGITPTATDTQTATPTITPTGSQPPITFTPTPTSTNTATPTDTEPPPPPPIITFTPTPTETPTPTATSVFVNPPPGSSKRTSTPEPFLPATGEPPASRTDWLEWVFAGVFLMVVAMLVALTVRRSTISQK